MRNRSKALVDTKVLKPQRGEKKQLVNLAIKNARVSLEQKFNLLEKSMEKTQGAIENLGKLLQIPTPVRIGSFDNSNIMGTSPVSAMVVFVNGKPSKRTIAKYKIKTVVGPDDYASMREVIPQTLQPGYAGWPDATRPDRYRWGSGPG